MLENITITPGTLVPSFNNTIHEYAIRVQKSTETLNVVAEFDEAEDTVTIGGVAASNGVAMLIAVNVGTTSIAISVISTDPDTGDTTEYNYSVVAIKLLATDREIEAMRHAWQKLDSLGYSFGLPMYSPSIPDIEVEKYFYGDLRDVMRELGITTLDNIPEMSVAEMRIEDRIVYYALRRFRNSAAVFFRFSTAADGKSVDKSMIPKMLAAMIAEYNQEWVDWRRSLSTGSLWTIPNTVQTNGDFESSSS